jgi:hypothetical protein
MLARSKAKCLRNSSRGYHRDECWRDARGLAITGAVGSMTSGLIRVDRPAILVHLPGRVSEGANQRYQLCGLGDGLARRELALDKLSAFHDDLEIGAIL